MGELFKTRHGSVFSHKRGDWGGMDQGKGDLYRGNTVEFMINVNNEDNVFTCREGYELKEAGVVGVEAGERTISGVSIISGTNFFFDSDFPSITP